MTPARDPISCLLSPQSIAIVGASADPAKYTGRTVKFLLKYRYPGNVYAVNPGRTDVCGIPCFPSVRDLPEAVDTAFLQIAAQAIPGVIEQCIARGVKSLIIHTAGLGESGEAGRKSQQRIEAQIREAGIRVVGPNCAGIVHRSAGMVLSPIACWAIDDLPTGRIGLISQSGGLTGAYVSRAADRGIGFGHVISTGNEMDLGVSEFTRYLLRDEQTDVIAIFLEALRNVELFREAAVEAMARQKPIVVLKVGRTEVGARAAASHTGALTGSDAVYDAFFRRYGIVRVETLEDLFEVPALFAKTRPPGGKNVGIITTTGGGATMVLEAAAQAGLRFPSPSDSTVREASAFLPSFAAKSNPLDVTMSGAGDGFRRGLDLLVRDDAFDAIVGVVGSSSQFEPELGVQPIVDVCRNATKPVVAFCNPNAADALRLFEKSGIPSFRTPEACGRALGLWVRYRETNDRFTRAREQRRAPDPGSPAAAAAREILAASAGTLNEYDSKRVLSAYGIAVTRERRAGSEQEARQAALEIGYPVAMKLLSADIPHKTEAGVVRLGVASDQELAVAYRDLLAKANAFKPDARIDGILVQEVAPAGGVEVIIGVKREAGFGPVLLFGLGGIFVELFRDVVLCLPPLSQADALGMIGEIRGAQLLQGWRGAAKMDCDAIAETLVRVADLSLDLGDRIGELDINPLIVYPEGRGVRVVDALICRPGDAGDR